MQSFAQTQTAGVDRAQIGVQMRKMRDRIEQPGDLVARQSGRLDNFALRAHGLEEFPFALEKIIEQEAKSSIQDALRTAV